MKLLKIVPKLENTKREKLFKSIIQKPWQLSLDVTATMVSQKRKRPFVIKISIYKNISEFKFEKNYKFVNPLMPFIVAIPCGIALYGITNFQLD